MKIWKITTSACFLIFLSGCIAVSTESQINYGLNHYKMGLYSHAIPPLVTAADSLEKITPTDPRLVDVLIALGEMAQSDKRKDLADGFFTRALKAAESLKPQDERLLRNSLVHLGSFYLFERPSDALQILARAEEISRTYDDQVLHAIDLDNLGIAYRGTKNYPRSSALSLQALAIINSITTGKLVTRTKGVILHNLGYTEMLFEHYKEAETHFKESLLVLRSDPKNVESWRVKTVLNSYAKLLRSTGRIQEATEFENQSGANVH